ncbi:MAG TPA: TerC family protein [Patescibacteria group bacterium]|jgi:predicted tellurium resistance membrane protein TerC|nr:TerC family protein [Patescibacteria group bacterium]
MMNALLNPDIWASFCTLCILEIVLGIDNIIFLSIVSSRLPKEKQHFARMVGLSFALILRVLLLGTIAWLAKLKDPIFAVMGHDFSWRDIILFFGGVFLMYKATSEIHSEFEHEEAMEIRNHKTEFTAVIFQIVMIDLLLSFDSIFTAVGVAEDLPVMVAAIMVAILIMLFASAPVADFVNEHPTVKMLALTFILLVGVVLVADSWHFHIPRGYLYFTICFSLGVEALNQTVAKKKRKAAKDQS